MVGNVAALVPHKGQRHFVEAAALVVREVPDARFVIAGEGELRPTLEHLIHHHKLEKHVVLAGFRPDVLSLHKAFDIFVMSSITEGLGTSLLDAMACGRPIVATTAGGMPEVVQDGKTGILVPPRDERAMADAIVKLLKDEALRERMGAAGLSLVNARFSAERMVADTLHVYEGVVQGSQSARATSEGWQALGVGPQRKLNNAPSTGFRPFLIYTRTSCAGSRRTSPPSRWTRR